MIEIIFDKQINHDISFTNTAPVKTPPMLQL